MKILLADDDPIACGILSMLLEAQGHEVIEAPDGELAWRLVQQGEINFVVSDWLMPNLAGVDLCRRIRASEFEQYVYVILCTSKGEKSDLIEGLDAGADDFLVKPISPEELRVKVRAGERVLSLQQGLAEKNRELAGINSQLQNAHRLVQDDLKAAAWMQQRLLPQSAHHLQNAMICEWRLEPSGYIAGDIFNVFPMNEHETAFYLLDVCGHGVPAAMLSVTLSMLLTPDATKGSPLKLINPENGRAETLPPEDAIRELNRRFQSLDDRYFTMIYGLFNQQTKTMRIAQAGHPGPILLRKGEAAQILGEGGMPLGLWPQIEFDCFELSVQPGDRIVLYSDGVTECNNANGEAFGEMRLLDCLQLGSALPLKDSLDELMRKIKCWRNADFTDDISLLAFEITTSQTSSETTHATFPGERYEIRRSHGRRSTDRKTD